MTSATGLTDADEEHQMDRDDRTRTPRSRRVLPPIRSAGAALIALALLGGPALAGCSEAHGTDGAAGAMATTMPAMDATAVGTAPEVVDAVWSTRPAFVGTTPAVEEAYAFALQHPEIVQWMPCYCGCAAMDHGSNLACYFRHGQVGKDATFDEHASYCDICVDITLATKQLHAQGVSLRQIRQIIDQRYSDSGAPGTPTSLPPV